MTHAQVVTSAVLAASFLLFCIWDVWLLVKKGVNATISRTLLIDAKGTPIIGVVIGVIVGHIFWSNCG